VLVLAIVFWLCVAALVYAQVGYGLLLVLLSRALRHKPHASWNQELPAVSVIVAAYKEQDGIGARVANLKQLDYPADRLEVIVAVDGSADETAANARAAGADQVLELPRGGKVPAQNAAVAAASGQIFAFSDANSSWQPDALKRLVDAFGDPTVGYVCGDVSFSGEDGDTNQEGLYWRYEMFMRRQESDLASITAGNGAIYAVRRPAYLVLGPVMSHDISFPFRLVKDGWRAIYAPDAKAAEKMAPSIEGEFARKRRMASRTWPSVVEGGMLSPRGYGPLYALMIFSHRILRYASPLLHVIAFAVNVALIFGPLKGLYITCLALQLGLLAAAFAAPVVRTRVALIARYYVWTTMSLGAGFIDWLRGAQAVTWEPVEGTR
jgi:cellulose synthase/poly-beta-1,6-N-acetylglucosamine synthase-like glycosyltransferase